MKTIDLLNLNHWENLRGQVKALSYVKDRVKEGANMDGLLGELADQIRALSDAIDRLEDKLDSLYMQLLADVGLMDAPADMKYQWECYAGDRERPNLIPELTELKESGEPLHQFLNRLTPPPDAYYDDDGGRDGED